MRRGKVKTDKGRLDYVLVLVVAFLILLGVLILASVSAAISQQKFNSPTFYLFHHVVYGLIVGALLGFVAFKIPLSLLRKWSPVLLLVNLFLMVLVFVPVVGITWGGAHSWLNLRIASFQPSELLKLTFILYLASWLAARAEKTKKELSKTLATFLVIISIIALLLILQPDVGTLGIIVATAVAMYFLAGTPLKHSFLILLAGGVALAALIKFVPYRLERFSVFLKPEIDPMRIGYHIKQALIAVGAGGIFGRGLGTSAQTFVLLPQRIADSIFALFAEETGLVGSLILIALFLIFAWRGFEIAKKSHDKFYQFSTWGITVWIVLQAFVNISAMVGILPLTGIPLPFISYGGSALVTELVGVGILLNISKHT